MRNPLAHKSSFCRTAQLAFAAIATLAETTALGVLIGTAGVAQSATMPQDSPAAMTAFESASVKLSGPNADPSGPGFLGLGTPFCALRGLQINGRRFAVTASPYALISIAYGKAGSNCRQADLLTGGPEWISSAAYDIEAIAPEGFRPDTLARFLNRDAPTLQMMLRTLLADRFKLKVHRATREISVYVLTAEKSANLTAAKETVVGVPIPIALTRRLDQNGRPYGDLVVGRGSMSRLATMLESVVGEPVQDKTGITGLFDVAVEFDNTGVARPTLAAALLEIGLKLEQSKVSMEVLVIDSVERPSED